MYSTKKKKKKKKKKQHLVREIFTMTKKSLHFSESRTSHSKTNHTKRFSVFFTIYSYLFPIFLHARTQYSSRHVIKSNKLRSSPYPTILSRRPKSAACFQGDQPCPYRSLALSLAFSRERTISSSADGDDDDDDDA